MMDAPNLRPCNDATIIDEPVEDAIIVNLVVRYGGHTCRSIVSAAQSHSREELPFASVHY